MAYKITITVEIEGDSSCDAWNAYESLIDAAINISNSEPATITIFEPESAEAKAEAKAKTETAAD